MTIVNETSLMLGCGPDLALTIQEVADGTLILSLSQLDPENPVDLDGLFFNLEDDSNVGDLFIFPLQGTPPITNFENAADAADSLSNGATLQDSYDVGVQFGETAGSTEGMIEQVSFTLFSDAGPLSIDSLDPESFASAVDTDGGNGMVLLPHNGMEEAGDGGGEEGPDDGVCTFMIEGDVNVEVTLTELENGDLTVSVNVLGEEDGGTGQIGDIRGVFFNLGDDSMTGGLTVAGDDVTDSAFAADGVINLGQGANMLGGGRDPFDGGVEIGTPGQSGDDIQSTEFTLSHPDGLFLEDFTGEMFGVRLTSVGEAGGNRDDSLKLTGECPPAQPPPPEPDCPDEYEIDYVAVLAHQADMAEDSQEPASFEEELLLL